MAATHVFLSYCGDNVAEARQLRNDLVAAGEPVWWDQDILPGQDWRQAIRQAIKDSFAVVLCLSKESRARTTSGMYPEALDAIAAYRQFAPGRIFLIPVRLNECEIPSIEIDATRTLDALQHVDLFPRAQRATRIRLLIEALRRTPNRPAADPLAEQAPAVADRVASLPNADVQTYLEDLKKDNASIAIRGLQVGTGKAYQFPIDQLYISLTTTFDPDDQTGKRERSDERVLQAADAPRNMRLEQSLQRQRLVIIGDPGAGKTTFLQRVAYALCQIQFGEAPPDDPFCQALGDVQFPILIRLASLLQCIERSRSTSAAPAHDDAPAWLPYHLAEVSRNDYGHQLDQAFFQQRLESGNCAVLLDGLDEAPDRLTRQMVSQLIENAAKKYDGCRFVVTSRPAAYTEAAVLPDFAHARIDALSAEAMETFLARWCGALYGDHQTAARQHCDELLRAIELRPDIRQMVHNPVMLTALAVVHWNERRLPEQRADLYRSIITWLARSREQRPGRPPADRTAAILGRLALAMQNHPDGRQTQVAQSWAADAIAEDFRDRDDPVAAAAAFLTDEELDSGIVVGRGHEIRFWHLTFQEYLAAKTISGLREAKQKQILLDEAQKLYLAEWREVVLLLAGILYGPGPDRVDGLVEVILEDLFAEPALVDEQPNLADQARCFGLLGAILRDLSVYEYRPADLRYNQLTQNVMDIFDKEKSHTVAIPTRVAASEALGRAGDPRPGVGLRTHRHALPDILWCDIPDGTLMMGSATDDKEAYDNEYGPDGKPFPVQVAPFHLAAYPVTCAQFRPFVEGDGYENRQYWTDAGWAWKESGSLVQPYLWDDPKWNVENYPVVGVTWYEAVAWCHWFTRRLREIGELSDDQTTRLPTEAEWEWAARGTQALKYPWGDEWRENACNNDAADIGRTCAVGLFPAGASSWLDAKHGAVCHDLSGNIWEWCATKWRSSYSVAPDESVEGDALRVLRGGCYGNDARAVRCSCRDGGNPLDWRNSRGFRCAQ